MRATRNSQRSSAFRPYRIFEKMWRRCTVKSDPAYKYYGGRGITVCKRWKSFDAFWKDMKEGYEAHLTIDRKNNNRGYSKANCHWITRAAQNRNRRDNIIIQTPWGKLCIAEAAERAGIEAQTLYQRVRRGWKKELFTHPDFIQQWPRVVRT